jgi:beta-galactosidase
VVHDGQQVDLGAEGFLGEYPWLTAWCGDLDICGGRRPQSYYREIVFGLRSDPYVAVHHPARHGRQVVYSGPWSWADVVESWTWDGYDGAPVTVEVYADADEVELLANGRSLGRRPAGPDHRYRAEFEATYEPGVLEAVAWRDGKELGRMQLRSASGPVLVDVQADRTEIAAEPSDLAFVALTLVDAAGARRTNADRPVKVNVDGPGVLEGLASANPRSEEPFTADTCTTFEGRALAVVRPTGAGTITVTASAEGCDARQVRITARSLSERRSASP